MAACFEVVREAEAREAENATHGVYEGVAHLVAHGSRNLAACIDLPNLRLVIEDAKFLSDLKMLITNLPRPMRANDPEACVDARVEYTLIEHNEECDTDRGVRVYHRREVIVDRLTLVKTHVKWNADGTHSYADCGRFAASPEALGEIAEDLADEIRERV